MYNSISYLYNITEPQDRETICIFIETVVLGKTAKCTNIELKIELVSVNVMIEWLRRYCFSSYKLPINWCADY